MHSTPIALIDQDILLRNIAAMQTRISQHGVNFRPHVKTTKCWQVVKAQLAAGATGITVSTLKEAEQFFAQGAQDILYAVGIIPSKLAQALDLRQRGCKLKIITDSVIGAQAIVDFGHQHQHQFEVWIEVDTDGHRSGIKPDSQTLIDVAQTLEAGAQHCTGVMTHAGASYELNTPEALKKIAEQERSLCVLAAQRIRKTGIACPNVSVGSTPTALSAEHLGGVTEVRAGVYVFNDLVMTNIGVCTMQDIAMSVLTTVIGHQAEKNWIIVDAGWMAMSRDRGTQKQSIDYGYGQVCDVQGIPIHGLTMTGANQEHGIISSAETHLDTQYPVGTLLRILPNHACATAAQFPEYSVMQSSIDDLQSWPRFYGW
jgi:threo-3-hydroxy-D-aspartate ammonia-lyase